MKILSKINFLMIFFFYKFFIKKYFSCFFYLQIYKFLMFREKIGEVKRERTGNGGRLKMKLRGKRIRV